MASDYIFRAMTAADLPLVQRWLALPHVMEWWGEPEEQYALLSGDLHEPSMDQFIFSTAFGQQPRGTRGIDLFIGELNMIGRGHGSALIRCFVDELFQNGLPRVMTDPDPANGRGVRAYQKAGFQKDRAIQTSDGPALLMVRNP